MKAFDWHVVPSTRLAGRKKTPEEMKAFEEHYRTKYHYDTEEEMIAAYRKADVRVNLHPVPEDNTLEGFERANDYVAGLITKYPDTIWGAMLRVPDGVEPGSQVMFSEIEKYRTKGFLFLSISGALSLNRPLSDKSIYPLYDYCAQTRMPVVLFTGMTGRGAGLRGGGGLHLWYDHPMHIDIVARDFPELNIVVSHPAWPWQDDMLAVLEHKGNVLGNDLHGWSPKYFTPSLKKRINSFMQDKFMFGSDYPLFTYERLFREWENEGYKPEVLEKVFLGNSIRILKELGLNDTVAVR